jgi:hypothetical protein
MDLTLSNCRLFIAIFSVFIPAAFTGCSNAPSEATGTVTYKGNPVVCGAVIFVGPDGMTKGANIEKMTGHYHITDVGSGPVQISVVSNDPAEPLDQEKPSNPKDPLKVNWSLPEVDRSKWAPLPKKYELIHTAGLTAVLKPGLNTGIDIVLE